MSFRRIIETEPFSVEAQLLRVGRNMQPPASAYRKTLVGLGITAGATTGASLASAAAATSAVSAKSVIAAWLGGTAAKGIVVGFVAGATVLGATQIGTTLHHSVPETTPSGSQSIATPRDGESKGELSPAPALASSLAPSETPVVTQLGSADPAAQDTKITSPSNLRHAGDQVPAQSSLDTVKSRLSPSGKSLGAEVALIDEVRDALRRQQAGRALDLLRQHQVQFTNASLGEEAMFLRARALEQLGRHSEAANTLQQFRVVYPDSTLSEQP